MIDKVPYNGREGDFQNREVANAFNFIQQNVLGNAVIGEAAPTSSTIKANTFVFWNNKLYVKLSNGTLYTITLTPV